MFFWNEATPQPTGSRFYSPSFVKHNRVWTQGYFVSVHPATRALILHSRADRFLNPSGVRFGGAEIYNVLERQLSDTIVDGICLGQRRPRDPDETLILFLHMKPGHRFNQKLVKRVIKNDLGPRHVPKFVFEEVPEIPVAYFSLVPPAPLSSGRSDQVQYWVI